MHACRVVQIKHVMYCTGQDEADCTLLNRCASVLSPVGSQPSQKWCAACFCSAICLDYGAGFGPITGSQREMFSSWHSSCNSLTNSTHSCAHEYKGDNTLESKWNHVLHSELRNIRSVIMALKKLLLAEVSHVGSVFIQHSFMFVHDTHFTQLCSDMALTAFDKPTPFAELVFTRQHDPQLCFEASVSQRNV